MAVLVIVTMSFNACTKVQNTKNTATPFSDQGHEPLDKWVHS
ncbi:MAG TPA: hypothetical protein PKM51_06630 [Chitinophagales bacterium]|nr:hypothetical protein [Chitinophagales bacterium]